MIVIKYEIIEEETKMRNALKKMILTAALVVTTLVVFPTNAEAKTKTLTYNIDKITADKFCKDIQSQGTRAVTLHGDKDQYKIVLTVKASSKKKGRAKVRTFAKKVVTAKSNKYGLSYGIKYDDFNIERYDAKKKVYKTILNNTANDIFYLNGITNKALHEEFMLRGGWDIKVKTVFPTTEDFKNSSESVKVQYILDYIGFKCMEYEDTHIRYSFKDLYYGKARGVCSDFSNVYVHAARLIGYNVAADRENNYAAKHSVALIKAKRSDNKYDYFLCGNNFIDSYSNIDFNWIKTTETKANLYKDTPFACWQVAAPDEFKVTKLEKGAYNYAKSGRISELDEILKSKYEHC